MNFDLSFENVAQLLLASCNKRKTSSFFVKKCGFLIQIFLLRIFDLKVNTMSEWCNLSEDIACLCIPYSH